MNDLLKDSSSGIVRQSGVFAACTTETQREKMVELIKDCQLAVDPLHNLKGHIKTIIQSLQKWNVWDEAQFVKLLADQVQRKTLCDLDGAHMR